MAVNNKEKVLSRWASLVAQGRTCLECRRSGFNPWSGQGSSRVGYCGVSAQLPRTWLLCYFSSVVLNLRLSRCLSLQGCRTAAPHSPGSGPGLFPLTQLFRILLELFSRSCPNRPYLMSHGPKVGYFAPPWISSWWDEWASVIGMDQLSSTLRCPFSSIQLSHVCLCDPMDCSMPGLPVHHQLPEFTQTCVHWVSDAIQPSHPLLSSSPPTFSLSQHQGIFQWVSQFFTSGGQSTGVSASASVLPKNTQDWFPLGWTGWISLQSKGLPRVFSNTTVQKHQFFGVQLSL